RSPCGQHLPLQRNPDWRTEGLSGRTGRARSPVRLGKRDMNFDQLKWDENGLIPAVVQDASTLQVLMVAYMNEQSLRATLDVGETVFWSRSRRALWHKGATSGN